MSVAVAQNARPQVVFREVNEQIANLRVVEVDDRFLVVEKIGEAGTIARAADPRRHD